VTCFGSLSYHQAKTIVLVHSVSAYALNECTSTMVCIWPDDSSLNIPVLWFVFGLMMAHWIYQYYGLYLAWWWLTEYTSTMVLAWWWLNEPKHVAEFL